MAEDTKVGGITWHSSDEDSGPDVGISVYLGPDDRLYAGEISRRLFDDHDGAERFDSDGGWFLVRYTDKEERLIAKFADDIEARDFMDQVAMWCREAHLPTMAKTLREQERAS